MSIPIAYPSFNRWLRSKNQGVVKVHQRWLPFYWQQYDVHRSSQCHRPLLKVNSTSTISKSPLWLVNVTFLVPCSLISFCQHPESAPDLEKILHFGPSLVSPSQQIIFMLGLCGIRCSDLDVYQMTSTCFDVSPSRFYKSVHTGCFRASTEPVETPPVGLLLVGDDYLISSVLSKCCFILLSNVCWYTKFQAPQLVVKDMFSSLSIDIPYWCTVRDFIARTTSGRGPQTSRARRCLESKHYTWYKYSVCKTTWYKYSVRNW